MRTDDCTKLRNSVALAAFVTIAAVASACGSTEERPDVSPDVSDVEANDVRSDIGVDVADVTDAGTDVIPNPAVCGDGNIEGREDCEPDVAVDCADFGFGFGAATCGSNCIADTSACNAVSICGDGSVDGNEECDDGGTDNDDGCSAECAIESCGDGIVQADEFCDGIEPVLCDDGASGWTQCNASCDAVETLICPDSERCGDGRIDAGEACDDGNMDDGDGCDAECLSETCGDEIAQSSEACDGPDLGGATCTDFGFVGGEIYCADNCAIRLEGCLEGHCGDGLRDGAEACDDGNAVSGDGCSRTCEIEVCGDGRRQSNLGEQCDDEDVAGVTCRTFGMQFGAIGCTDTCLFDATDCVPWPECGDGNIDDELAETCDDGNTMSGDGCSSGCREESCGDGVIQPGEECDASFVPSSATCTNEGFAGGVVRCDASCELDYADCFESGCGNGLIEDGEECDGQDRGGATCLDSGFDYGRLSCTDDCELDPGSCRNLAVCGDGERAALEECDDGNLSDGDGCASDCILEFCGDGITQPVLGETCDGSAASAAFCSDGSSGVVRCDPEQCEFGPIICYTSATCGDGVIDIGETCDDGNRVDDAACNSDCTQSATCGDGNLQAYESCDADISDLSTTCTDAGFAEGTASCVQCRVNYAACEGTLICGDGIVEGDESCDDGNITPDDGCSADCLVEGCGNNVVEAGETCDDGDIDGGDGCSSSCQIEACGNDIIDVGEQCDDGSTDGGDGCSATCQTEACGNNTIDVGEQCDDGNTDPDDGCSAACTDEFCGNGFVEGTETCDDTNTDGGDGCSAACQTEVCGNNTVDVGEECDDGNTDAGDGCDSLCVTEFCGDNILQPSEECDDGNSASNDGCSSSCRIEFCGDEVVNGDEECDEGRWNSDTSGDTCRTNCTLPSCGDLVWDEDYGEMCDGTYGCEVDCTSVLPCRFGTCEPTCERAANVVNGATDSDDDADGMSEDAGDCDDTRPDVYTGAPELFDGVDNDCDDRIDDNIDDDCDGELGPRNGGNDCGIYDYLVGPNAPDHGFDDNNCDGVIGDLASGDADADGFAATGTTGNIVDCDDNDGNVFPAAPEIIGDGIDNNCDGIELEVSDASGVFVAPDGDDANDGTAAAPLATIGAGMSRARSQGMDAVFVAAGTYLGRVTVSAINVYGSFDQTTWTRTAGPPTSTIALLDDNDNINAMITIQSRGVLDGFSVARTGTYDALDLGDGAFINGALNGRCEVRTGGFPSFENSQLSGTIDVNGGSYLRIINSDIFAGIPISQSADVLIAGSVLDGGVTLSQNGSVQVSASVILRGIGTSGATVLLVNNIIAANISTNAETTRLIGNLLATGLGSVGGQSDAAILNTCAFTSCIEAYGNLVGDPLFVGAGDYHITSGSDAIDAGVNPSGIISVGYANDRDGDPRDFAAFDIGIDATN